MFAGFICAMKELISRPRPADGHVIPAEWWLELLTMDNFSAVALGAWARITGVQRETVVAALPT